MLLQMSSALFGGGGFDTQQTTTKYKGKRVLGELPDSPSAQRTRQTYLDTPGLQWRVSPAQVADL